LASAPLRAADFGFRLPGAGPFGFKPTELEAAIERELSS